MKHIGKMKNNNAKVVVAYRTLPGDPSNALVVGTAQLGESYHNALMNLVQDPMGQQANEFADILAVRKFPDGNTMLSWLHQYGHLKKVPTDMVIMTPTPQSSVALDELNRLIAEQRGVDVADLAITEDVGQKTKQKPAESKTETPKTVSTTAETAGGAVTPEMLRAQADKLMETAKSLLKKAEEMSSPQPVKKKGKAEKVIVE